MITALDHVVVLTGDIEAATAAYQTLFARSPSWKNFGDGTARVLFTLDNTTLELMAPSGEGESANRIRSVLITHGEGLASLCFRTNDIEKMHRRLERLTLKPEPVSEVESQDVITGATLSWKRTRAATEATGGVRMFFLEREKERPLSVRTTVGSITAMDHVVVATADPERAAALYGARLGLDMALDRSHPDWGRLMFFRCGDLIVEVAHKAGKEKNGGDGAGPAARPVLARHRHRCHPCAACGRRRRGLRSPHRSQARHPRHDCAQRHLRRPDADRAALGEDGVDANYHNVVPGVRRADVGVCSWIRFPNGHHCERSEAIHCAAGGEMDCFVASLLAMTMCYASTPTASDTFFTPSRSSNRASPAVMSCTTPGPR
jgi:catechol 2,3-dioxygenase-like lactoylglutathione lyase family enzyme